MTGPQRRHRLKLTQTQCAALVGVTTNTVARWEQGARGVQPATARLIELFTAQKGRQ